jgi:glycosyltransferase involved in cell wall biosynthesis
MNTPLRIGIFTDDFFPKSGGVARSIELQIGELVRMGHEVILFAPKPFFIAPDNCRSEALDSWYIPGTQSFLCSVKFGKKLAARIAKQYKFDVVHSQNERGSMFLAAQIAQTLGVPHVHTFHSNYAGTHRTSPIMSAINSLSYMYIAPRIMKQLRPERSAMKIYFPRKLAAPERSKLARADWKNVAKLARYTDAFTSPAEFVIESIVDASRGALAERAYVVGNGVSSIFKLAQRIRPHEETLRFLSCGRLDPEKRVDIIIKAFAKLNRADAELYILGAGSEEKRLKKLVAEKVKKGTVLFLGHYNDIERIANEYANADVFVFASYRFDTQGMVLAEAAASGTPILYCDDRLHIGVTPENAMLVNPSVSAFEEGMRYYLNNRETHADMVRASKIVGKTVTADIMEEKFVAIYREVIRNPYADNVLN